jgi:hypothetical protein
VKTPAHSIIYTGGGGRLGNQLIRFAHWLAWIRAQEENVQLINVAFWPFAPYFVPWNEEPGCIYPRSAAGAANLTSRLMTALPDYLQRRLEVRWQLLIQKAGGRWPNSQSVVLRDDVGEAIDLDSPFFMDRLKQRRITMCRGWKISSWRLFAEQQDELRKLFQPAPRFLRRARAFIKPLRERYDVVAGLFIRQSDYREWRDGRFYFPTSEYRAWISQLIDLHAGRRVGVVIASEEVQDLAGFAGLSCHFTSGSRNVGGHWFASFAELSLCDFILSPPSTFSASAAFVGRIPLWPLVESKQTLSLDQLLPDSMVQAARHPLFSLSVK